MAYRMLDDELKVKIQSFRVSDLQTLVGCFGRSRNGKKQELQNRALEILKTRPTDVDLMAYRAKINELYRIAQDEAKQSHYEYANQRQSNPQQRTVGNIYIPQNPYNVSQANKPTNPIMYQNGSIINAGGYPNTGVYPSQVAAQPAVQPPTIVACNLTDSVRIVASPLTHTDITFRPLPFYKIRHEILKPTVMKMKINGRNNNSSQVFQISFVLTCQIASDIAMHRDFTKNDFPVQVQLRICAIDNANSNQIQPYDDFLPLGLYVRMNDKLCPLPPSPPVTRPNAESRRVPLPINITQFMKLSPMNLNKLTINWTTEVGKTFVLMLNTVEKLSATQLLENLKERLAISVDVTKEIIAKQYKRVIDDGDDENANADDDDISTTIVRVSLQCPLAKFRMIVPAKGRNCSHLQCFDGSAYISLNEKKSVWMCPVCNRSLLYDDLLIDQYFVDVLASDLSSDCQEVQLFADGSWKIYDEENNAENNEKSKHKDTVPNSPSENVSLCSSGDNSNDQDQKLDRTDQSVRSETNNAVATLETYVDLTLDDDDTENDRPASNPTPTELLPEVDNEPTTSHGVDLSQQCRTSSTPPVSPVSPASVFSPQSVDALNESDISVATTKYNPVVMSRTTLSLVEPEDIDMSTTESQNSVANSTYKSLVKSTTSSVDTFNDDQVSCSTDKTRENSDDTPWCTPAFDSKSTNLQEKPNSTSDFINTDIISLMDDSPPSFSPGETSHSPPTSMAALNLDNND